MSAATLAAPAPSHTRRGGGSRDTIWFRAAIAVVALHVADDNFLQPQPGTTPVDHLAGGLVQLALLALAAWAFPRLAAGRRGALALVAGPLAIATGIEAFHYTREVGPSGDDFTGLLALAAGLVLLGLGAAVLWRSRRTDDRLWWRYPRRLLLAVAGVLVTGLFVFPAGLGYVTTHVGRAVVPTNELRVPYEDVRFETADGLELRGWYIASRNGAAVIAFPGRKGPQKQARMLARHGYGVLLFDRRGEGESEGDPNSWGWGGEKDVEAAIAYLRGRPDVDPARIGAIGLSVGGEMLLETAAESDGLAAVVSDGAGARSYAEDRYADAPSAVEKALGTIMSLTKTASVAIGSNQLPPPDLARLTGRIEQPLLLIAAPNSGHGEEINRRYARAAGSTAELWELPEAGHVGGIDARPAEYERRVVAHFDGALLP